VVSDAMIGTKVRIFRVPHTYFYIIVDKSLGKPMGYLGIENSELIGMYIDESYRKQGYGTDAVETVRKYFPNIIVTTHVENTEMQGLLNRLGFSKWLKYTKE